MIAKGAKLHAPLRRKRKTMQTAKRLETADDYRLKNAIEKSLFIRVDDYQNVPIYTSITCYFIADMYKPLQRQHLILEAVKAFRTRDPRDGCGQKLRVLTGGKTKDYYLLWAIQDEESITLMFPEDF